MAMHDLPRRRFLRTGLVLAGCGLLAGCAMLPSQPPRLYRIGHLWAGTPTPEFRVALRDQLRELGYVDGQSIAIEDRVAGGRSEPLPALVAELIRHHGQSTCRTLRRSAGTLSECRA